MRPRGSQYHPRRSFGRPRVPSVLSGVVFGGCSSSPGTLLNAPGLLWGTIWGAWEEHVDRFEMIFVSQSGVRRENSEKLEFGDLLSENAMCLKPQGSKMVPQLAKRRKKSKEEAKREQRVP